MYRENEDSTRKLHELEAFLAKLKLATGVVDLGDIAEKFATQRVSRVYLDEEVRAAERRLAALKEDLLAQQLAFRDERAAEVGQADVSQLAAAQLEADMEVARAELKAGTAQAERRASTLLDLQQGTNGLLQRLLPYSAEVAAELDSLDIRHNIQVTLEDSATKHRSTVDALAQIDALLTKMVEIIETEACNSDDPGQEDGEEQDESMSLTNGTRNLDLGTTALLVPSESQSLLVLTNTGDFSQFGDSSVLNIRVKSRKMQRNDESELIRRLATPPSKERSRERSSRAKGGERGGSGGRTLDSLIPSRELVKQKSERMLREETQRRARTMKKNALLQQQSTRRKSLALALQAAATQQPSQSAVPGSAGGEEDDDAKLAADREYKMIAQGLAVKEQRDYCAK